MRIQKLNKKIVPLILSLFFLFAGVFSTTFSSSEAISLGICDDKGSSLSPGSNTMAVSSLSFSPVQPNAGSRLYTFQELFANQIIYPHNYVGEKEEYSGFDGFFLADNGKEALDLLSDDEAARSRIEGNRNLQNCLLGGIGKTSTPSLFLFINDSALNIARTATTALFTDKLFCSEGNTEGCIDLAGAIGGDGSTTDRGIMGNIFDGIYFPLVTLFVLASAVWFIYNGLFKRKFREALTGILWTLFAFAIGLWIMHSPNQFARIPQNFTNAFSSLLVGAVTDEGSVYGGVGNVSKSAAYGDSTPEKASFDINSLNASIWSSITLESWSQLTFGTSYTNLYTTTDNMPSTGTLYPEEMLVGRPEDYCVSLYSDSSPADMVNNYLNNRITSFYGGSDKRICNIAIAQLASVTNADFNQSSSIYINEDSIGSWLSTIGGRTSAESRILETKFKVITQIAATAAKNPAMWSYWGTGEGRLSNSIIYAISSIMLAVSITIIAIFGIVFSFLSTFLLIFAPIFLLFALHPGKGKRIFLGWLETVVSNILKFMITSLLVLVALIIYSAVVNSTSGFMTLLMSMAMTFTFISLRKEIVELVGATNMGGLKVANNVSEGLNRIGRTAGRYSDAVIGGSIGGVMAGAGIKAGASNAVKQQMKRGTGIIAQSARQKDRLERQAGLEKYKEGNWDKGKEEVKTPPNTPPKGESTPNEPPTSTGVPPTDGNKPNTESGGQAENKQGAAQTPPSTQEAAANVNAEQRAGATVVETKPEESTEPIPVNQNEINLQNKLRAEDTFKAADRQRNIERMRAQAETTGYIPPQNLVTQNQIIDAVEEEIESIEGSAEESLRNYKMNYPEDTVFTEEELDEAISRAPIASENIDSILDDYEEMLEIEVKTNIDEARKVEIASMVEQIKDARANKDEWIKQSKTKAVEDFRGKVKAESENKEVKVEIEENKSEEEK